MSQDCPARELDCGDAALGRGSKTIQSRLQKNTRWARASSPSESPPPPRPDIPRSELAFQVGDTVSLELLQSLVFSVVLACSPQTPVSRASVFSPGCCSQAPTECDHLQSREVRAASSAPRISQPPPAKKQLVFWRFRVNLQSEIRRGLHAAVPAGFGVSLGSLQAKMHAHDVLFMPGASLPVFWFVK